MPHLQLGKHRAADDKRDRWFRHYVKPDELPTPPEQFGNENLFTPRGWGMLGNDQWGDCAWAGAAHETMLLLTLEGGYPAWFTPEGVLSDYASCTGFDPYAGPPGRNPTDRGSNVRDVLTYRARTGLIDTFGNRHKIGAYVKLDERNLEEIWQALYIFQAVGIGIEFPSTAAAQFQSGQPWDVVPGAEIEGGHYVPLIAKREHLEVITWGQIQPMTVAFFEEYCDEAWAYVSAEDLVSDTDPQGFNLKQLRADLGRV